MYRTAERVSSIHLGAIRKHVSGKKVWFGTDEWTDTQGHAIINVILGCHSEIFVVATMQFECRGPNLGVEHTEVGAALVDVISKMGVSLLDVVAFVTDSAAVLKKAYDVVLKPLCPNAVWVPCVSHSLNNVAKCILNGLDDQLSKIFEKGPGLLHAKKYAARRRRWFAFLRSQKEKLSVPPRYISTRWTIWCDVSNWWFDNIDLYRRFMGKELGMCCLIFPIALISVVAERYVADKVPQLLKNMHKLVSTGVPKLKATMVCVLILIVPLHIIAL